MQLGVALLRVDDGALRALGKLFVDPRTGKPRDRKEEAIAWLRRARELAEVEVSEVEVVEAEAADAEDVATPKGLEVRALAARAESLAWRDLARELALSRRTRFALEELEAELSLPAVRSLGCEESCSDVRQSARLRMPSRARAKTFHTLWRLLATRPREGSRRFCSGKRSLA
jgi:hypothetical protein